MVNTRNVAIVGFIFSAGLFGFGLYDLVAVGHGWGQTVIGAAGLVVHGVIARTEIRDRRTPLSVSEGCASNHREDGNDL